MKKKPPTTRANLQRTQIYLPPSVIDQIRGYYPGLKTSEAIRTWIMSRLHDPHDEHQSYIKDMTDNIRTKGSKR